MRSNKTKNEAGFIGQPGIDWVRIIITIGTVITTIMTTYMTLKMQENAMRQQRVENQLTDVVKQSSGAVTAAKKAVAISAENLAVETQNPNDIKRAEEAKQEYDAQAEISKKVQESQPPKQ